MNFLGGGGGRGWDGGGAIGWAVGVTGAGVEASCGRRRGVVERVGWVEDGGVGNLRVLK